jgi:hypothetical protein
LGDKCLRALWLSLENREASMKIEYTGQAITGANQAQNLSKRPLGIIASTKLYQLHYKLGNLEWAYAVIHPIVGLSMLIKYRLGMDETLFVRCNYKEGEKKGDAYNKTKDAYNKTKKKQT